VVERHQQRALFEPEHNSRGCVLLYHHLAHTTQDQSASVGQGSPDIFSRSALQASAPGRERPRIGREDAQDSSSGSCPSPDHKLYPAASETESRDSGVLG
jgi:hypothetical protein